MTTLNDTCVLGAGKSATLQEESKTQTFALKVQHNEDIRRFAIPELAWEPLIKKVAELFKLREDSIVLKYKDEEGDLVTITSAEELLVAQRLAIQQSTLLRLYAYSAVDDRRAQRKPASVAAASNALPLRVQDEFAELSPSELKSQRRLMKEQRKLLKEGKKEAKLLKHEQKELRREQKKAAREARIHAKFGDVPFDPSKGSWREQRMAMRQQKMKPGQTGGSPAGEQVPGECKRWRDLSREERQERRDARTDRREAAVEGRRGKNRLVARFVKHVTIPDGATLAPRQSFIKTWRLRNEGEEAWPAGSKLIFISRKNGDQLGAPDHVVLPGVVQQGHEIDISVDMVAPEQPGRYVGFWRLCTPEDRKFGQRIWVKIDVICSSSSEDEASAPVVPRVCGDDATPVASAGPYDKLEQEVEQSFFEISKDEDDDGGKPKQPASGDKPTIAQLLKQLKQLGFSDDIGRNIRLLKKHDGDLDKVIAELIA